MRLITSWLVVAGVIAGVGGAILGYHAVSAGTNVRPVAAPVTVPTATPTPQVRIRLLPCESGWTQHGKACVRVRTKVVVVTAPSTAARSTAFPVRAKSPQRSRGGTSATTQTRPVDDGAWSGSGAGGVGKDD